MDIVHCSKEMVLVDTVHCTKEWSLWSLYIVVRNGLGGHCIL